MENREIKFRAWDGDKKEMHLPESSDKEDFHILPDGTIVETHEYGYERHELTSCRPESWILMQFTGLLDKNGKEIYEGDIICIPKEVVADSFYGFERKEPEAIFHVVKWDKNLGAWDVIRREDEGVFEEVEIVGNIFEHRHLIEPTN